MTDVSKYMKTSRARFVPECSFILAAICVCTSILFVGCAFRKVSALAKVGDCGPSISTRNHYRVVEFSMVEELAQILVKQPSAAELQKNFEQHQPNVFAAAGLPIAVRLTEWEWGAFFDDQPNCALGVFTGALCVFSIAGIPCFNATDYKNRYAVELVDLRDASQSMELYEMDRASVALWTPLPLAFAPYICRMDWKGQGGQRIFSTKRFTFGGDDGKRTVEIEALAYGVAVMLKKMEDSGAVETALAKIAAQKREEEQRRKVESERLRLRQNVEKSIQMDKTGSAGKPPYKLTKLAREEGSDFAYSFSLELTENTSIQTFFGVQNVFANEVLLAYMVEYPNANSTTLRVSVHPRLDDGRIVGRAEVLTITPVSLSYDAGTRRGKLSVRFNPGQAEEARAWIRKNIETLARDKNIAVTTGQTPPAATYYSLGERIDGNVMEIEFKTE